MRVTIKRIVLAVLTAAALITIVAARNDDLFYSHNRLCVAILKLAEIPAGGEQIVDVFPGFGRAAVPGTPVTRLETNPIRIGLLFAAGLIVLIAVYRRFPLARGFVLFLLALLLITAVAVSFLPKSTQFGAVEFSQIWLRGEILVWLLLPLFSAGMFMLIQPYWLTGVCWTVGVQAFGFLWSAARLAFCIGVMHFSGVLFIPLLWFALGLLADMVYLMVFYSMAVHWSTSRYWGRRAE